MRLPGITPPQLGLKVMRVDPEAWLVSKLDQHPGSTGLRWSLNQVTGLEERRALIAKGLAATPRVFAIARACDSGLELISALVKHGVAPERAKPGNLSSRDIAHLRPSSAIFIESKATFRRRKLESLADARRMYDFVNHVRKAPETISVLELDFDLADMTTKVLDVGLAWERRETQANR